MTQKILAAMNKNTQSNIRSYHELLLKDKAHFLGYVMNIGYSEATIITNDFFKIKNNGIPKNSFLLILPDSVDQNEYGGVIPPHLILARVLEPVGTPLATDVSRTYFELHKNQMPEIDVFTKSDLQWSALKVSILGTFYDNQDHGKIDYGADIETFLSSHMYSVHVPKDEILQNLINLFVNPNNKQRLGRLRYTETNLTKKANDVLVYTSPDDFIGSRTAFFGKTRMGKSNTVKKVMQMILDSKKPVGQVVFDLNGEYAYKNEQDNTSIFDLYPDRCTRYTLRDNPEKGVKIMKANFYEDLSLGHLIIKGLYHQVAAKPGDYEKAFLEWEVLNQKDLNELRTSDPGQYTRYLRQEMIYKCVLKRIGFIEPKNAKGKFYDLKIKKEIIEAVNEANGTDLTSTVTTLDEAKQVYSAVWTFFTEGGDKKKSKRGKKNAESYDDESDSQNVKTLFKSSSGNDYFDDTAKSMLTMMTGKKENGSSVSGALKLKQIVKYHSADGGNLLESIVEDINKSKTVILDLSNAPEDIYNFFSEMIAHKIFASQMEKFTTNNLGDLHIQFFFEEAHNIFPANDKDLTNIYNRLAKEGAKLKIGVGYSTQSISSLSPDLLKNTENFFIAHLNDEKEIRELSRFYEFQDVGEDVQRTKARGFVRLITRSHKFALPVQIDKFEG